MKRKINYKKAYENLFYVLLGTIVSITFTAFMLKWITNENQKDIERLINQGYTQEQAVEAVIYE